MTEGTTSPCHDLGLQTSEGSWVQRCSLALAWVLAKRDLVVAVVVAVAADAYVASGSAVPFASAAIGAPWLLQQNELSEYKHHCIDQRELEHRE